MTISNLVEQLRQAKQAENEAKAERLRIEGLITEQFAKPESNVGTHNDEDFTNDKLRYIVVDCRWMDKKEDNTIFENTKCRDDMYNFLIKNKGRISEKVKI